jgi:hypothetical protein
MDRPRLLPRQAEVVEQPQHAVLGMGAAGVAGRARDRGEPAHGRARGGTAAPGARGRGTAVRFETPPGKQMQVDFGEKRVVIGGEMVRAYLFVATLGHSRRVHVRAFRHERQACWFEGMESAFRAFGGMPEEVLPDYVTGHIIVVLYRSALCGQRRR